MLVRAILVATIVTLGLETSPLAAKDWIFDDGPYTVDSKTGKRVDQFRRRRCRPLFLTTSTSRPTAALYIPFGYYEENLGIGFGYGGYGGYGGGFGYGGYGGYGFGSGYGGYGGYAF